MWKSRWHYRNDEWCTVGHVMWKSRWRKYGDSLDYWKTCESVNDAIFNFSQIWKSRNKSVQILPETETNSQSTWKKFDLLSPKGSKTNHLPIIHFQVQTCCYGKKFPSTPQGHPHLKAVIRPSRKEGRPPLSWWESAAVFPRSSQLGNLELCASHAIWWWYSMLLISEVW